MKRQPIIWGIILIFIMISFNPIASSNITNRENYTEIEDLHLPNFLTYDIFFDFSYNSTVFEEPISLMQSVMIPITIRYWTSIPDIFSRIPPKILNLLLYNKIFTSPPIIKINLEVKNIPYWADIYFTSSTFYGGMPFSDSESYERSTSLVITCYESALAMPYRFELCANTDGIGRVTGVPYSETVEITPETRLAIELSGFDNILTPPSEIIEFPMHIKNIGNTKVSFQLKNDIIQWPWLVMVNPQGFLLNVSELKTVAITLFVPDDFSGSKIYYLTIRVQPYPYYPDAPSKTYKYYFQVHYP